MKSNALLPTFVVLVAANLPWTAAAQDQDAPPPEMPPPTEMANPSVPATEPSPPEFIAPEPAVEAAPEPADEPGANVQPAPGPDASPAQAAQPGAAAAVSPPRLEPGRRPGQGTGAGGSSARGSGRRRGGERETLPAATVAQNTGAGTSAATAESARPAPAPEPASEIRVNFQNAPLSDVLTYLSEAAGFIIVQEAQVSGTVNIVSRQPINADEAVDLLNTVLAEKGYTALRSGRILRIVNRRDAPRRDIPVELGSDPARIPKRDQMVTQILPIRYGEAAKLIENLRPLLAPEASITANEGSNAILLTDTQTNIHRIAQIIRALDTSVSGISVLRVFQLQFADAKEVANVITQLFATNQVGQTQQGRGSGQGGGGRGGRGGFGGGMGQGAAAGQTGDARTAAMRVVAVADEQSNSVIVSAPDETMPEIAEIITRIDTNITDVTETQLFRLKHADATEMASLINSLYGSASQTAQVSGGRGQGGGPQGRGGGGGGGAMAQASMGASQRSLLQSQVVAVPDARTNTVLVSASRDTMLEIAQTIGRLDASKEKKQRVFIHKLDNADADNVAAILQGMLGNTTSASSQPSTSRLNERTTTGASTEITDAIGTSSGRSTTGR